MLEYLKSYFKYLPEVIMYVLCTDDEFLFPWRQQKSILYWNPQTPFSLYFYFLTSNSPKNILLKQIQTSRCRILIPKQAVESSITRPGHIRQIHSTAVGAEFTVQTVGRRATHDGVSVGPIGTRCGVLSLCGTKESWGTRSSNATGCLRCRCTDINTCLIKIIWH